MRRPRKADKCFVDGGDGPSDADASVVTENATKSQPLQSQRRPFVGSEMLRRTGKTCWRAGVFLCVFAESAVYRFSAAHVASAVVPELTNPVLHVRNVITCDPGTWPLLLTSKTPQSRNCLGLIVFIAGFDARRQQPNGDGCCASCSMRRIVGYCTRQTLFPLRAPWDVKTSILGFQHRAEHEKPFIIQSPTIKYHLLSRMLMAAAFRGRAWIVRRRSALFNAAVYD